MLIGQNSNGIILFTLYIETGHIEELKKYPGIIKY